MFGRVALVRTDVSEELSASFFRVTRISELGTKIAVTSNRRNVRPLLVAASVVRSSQILVTLMNESLSSSKTSVLTRVTRRNIPEDAILRVNLKLVSAHLPTYLLTHLPHHQTQTFRVAATPNQFTSDANIALSNSLKVNVIVSWDISPYTLCEQMNSVVLIDVLPCGSCKIPQFGGN
jgi:hypothetical protein